MQIENFSASLTTLLGSAEKAQKMLSDLQEMAKKTPFETGDLLKSTQMMLAFGIEANKTKDYLQVLGDISMGDSVKLEALTRAFGQMGASGKASMEDINQMVDQGFNPLLYISKQTGESMSDLRDKVSNGKVSFNEIAKAMQFATSEGQPFFESMDKASETTTGKISSLKDEFGKATGELTDNLLPVITDLVDKFSQLASQFNELEPEDQKKILDALLVLGSLGPILLVANGLITAFSTLWGIMAGLGGAMNAFGTFVLSMGGTIGSVLAGVGSAVAGVLATIGGGVVAIGAIFAAGIALIVAGIGFAIWYAVSNWEAFTTGLKYLFNMTVNFIKNIFVSIGNFIGGIASWIANIFMGAFNAVVNGAKWMWNTIIGFVGSIGVAIGKAIWGTIKGIVNGILYIAETTINGFINGLNNVISLINKIPGVGIGSISTLNIPKLATGTNNVKREGLAYLHSGEAVVPKKYNPAVGEFNNNNQNIIINIQNNMTRDSLGQLVNDIKTFSNGSKLSYQGG